MADGSLLLTFSDVTDVRRADRASAVRRPDGRAIRLVAGTAMGRKVIS
jgi:hypothetical protein